MNCLMSLTVWLWLNFATSLVPSASRIWREVVGRSGSSGTDGGAEEEEDEEEMLDAPAEEGVEVFTSGAKLNMQTMLLRMEVHPFNNALQ